MRGWTTGVRFSGRRDISLRALGFIHSLTQFVPKTVSAEVKWPVREPDGQPPSSVEVNGGALHALPHMSSWHSAKLIKCKGDFTFYLCDSYSRPCVYFKVKAILLPTVSRPVHPGVRHPSGTRDQCFPFSLCLFFRQFRVSWYGAPSLTRSRVRTFQFLPGIASAAFLRCESHGTHEHSLLSLILRLTQPGGPGSCIYFPQEQSSPDIPLGIGFV
jgi:hypothetical protein